MPGMRSLPLPEVLRLLDRLPVKYQALCAIGVTTGSRITEILSLRRFDLLDKEGRMKERITLLRLKNHGRDLHRKLSIPAAFHPYILNHLIREEEKGYDRPDDMVFRGHLGKGLSRLTAYQIFRSFLGEGYGTHWMRKTFAKEMFAYFLRQNSADPMRALELTRQALGHARLDTTVLYLGITEESITAAQNAVFNISPGKEIL